MLKPLPASIICLFLTTVFSCVFATENSSDDKMANLCGDLIARYTATPDSIADKLHFQQCKIIGGQELVRATYTVNNADSVVVENYFMKKYQMPKLDWVDMGGKLRCHGGICIFGTPKVFGEAFYPEKITKLQLIDPTYCLFIQIKAVVDVLKLPQKATIPPSRGLIKTFKIEVSIWQSP